MASHRARWLVAVSLAALAGCAATQVMQRLTLPDQFTLARHQLLLHSDFPLPPHHRLWDDLLNQQADLVRQLRVPTAEEPIHVYVFESAERFDRFMRLNHPGFPERRAFFVETDSRLAVYAQWGDRVAEDLRHEVTHAYLHAVLDALPLWLDEGLAEYFEAPRSQRGFHRSHVERLLARMRQTGWQPNLRRLEQLNPERDLNQDDYAECWAWVHFLLESRPETAEVLRSYLADLRRSDPASPLSARLDQSQPGAAEQLVEHVRGLAAYLSPAVAR